jgi:hypothetical protein
MLSGKRTAAAIGVLLLAVAAFVATSSRAAHGGKGPQQPATPAPQYQPPTIKLDADTQVVTLCPDAESIANPRVRLKAQGFSPEGKPLRYKWTVSGGRLDSDEGTDVVWDLSDAPPDLYTASVTVESGPVGNPLCTAFTSTRVVVRTCQRQPLCPNITMSCPDGSQRAGTIVTLNASATGGTPGATPVYDWSVSPGTILTGQGTESIKVNTAGLQGQTIMATVKVTGYGAGLSCSVDCQVPVTDRLEPDKIDEVSNVRFDDEKARLDNFAVELQNRPRDRAHLIGYGGQEKDAPTGLRRAERARAYLVEARGIDRSRIDIIDGGPCTETSLGLWIVRPGAEPPQPTPPCPLPRRRQGH